MSNGIKKILIIGTSLLVILACAFAFAWKYQYELSMQFPDQNGESKELCLITREMIEKYTEDYRSIRRNVISKQTNSSGVSGDYEDCDNEYTKTKIGLLSGIYVCNAYLGNGEKVQYVIDSTVFEGNLLIALTDENNKILYEIPNDQVYEVSFQTELGKVYYLKFIGESAHIDVEIQRYR